MDQSGDGNNGVEALMLETLRSRLTASGDLSKIKSELRAMIYNDLRDGEKGPMNTQRSDLKSPTSVANHLVIEYLEWMGFMLSADMFSTESGCVGGASREIVETKVGMKAGECDKEFPLLLSLAINMLNEKDQK
jgi:hypothetical protein